MKLTELGVLPLAIASTIFSFADLFDLLDPTIPGDRELEQTAKTGTPTPRFNVYNSNCVACYSWDFIGLRPINVHEPSVGGLYLYFSGITTFYWKHNNLLSRTNPR